MNADDRNRQIEMAKALGRIEAQTAALASLEKRVRRLEQLWAGFAGTIALAGLAVAAWWRGVIGGN